MPLIFRTRGFRFPVYSNEGDPREPMHVAGDGADAKFRLYPTVSVTYNKGFNARTQAALLEIVEAPARRDCGGME